MGGFIFKAYAYSCRICLLEFFIVYKRKKNSGKCDTSKCMLQMNLSIKRTHYIFNEPQYVSHKG